jgi:hypothetical protein
MKKLHVIIFVAVLATVVAILAVSNKDAEKNAENYMKQIKQTERIMSVD